LPVAPELAARAAGIQVTLSPILHAYARLATQADVVVVEGVGGWAAPLSATLDQADVAHALQLPVLLVVGLRLGCLNHAYLSARAIVADGCTLAGWIASDIDPSMQAAADNFDILTVRLPAPCWGRLPYRPAPDAVELAGCLHLPD
jgi:dethiobiotin synthetase